MRRSAVALVAALALVATACGGGSESETEDASSGFVIQGEQTLDTDEVTTTTESTDADGGGGAGEGDGSPVFDTTEDTIPDGEDDDTAQGAGIFEAMNIFSSCLEVEGYQFIGAPNPEDDSSPTNDPAYLDALGTCAAASNIQQAFQDFQNASGNLTTEQIETRNRTLVFWVDCMEGRGWQIGEPSVDAKGLQTPTDLTPPDGEDLLGSDDLEECSGSAGREYEESIEETES